MEAISATGVFSNRGTQVVELENRIARWVGVSPDLVVVMSSATMALSVAVSCSPAKSWTVPAWTFPATAAAVIWLGKKVRPVDIDRETWLPKREINHGRDVEGLISVVPFGGSLSPDYIGGPGELIVDAAASFPSRPQLAQMLSPTACAVFSFHATKTMGGAEGGVAVFGSTDRAERARSVINFGFSGSRESVVLGVNGKMSEYDAAVVNARFDGWAQEAPLWERLRDYAETVSTSIGAERAPQSMKTLNPYWIVVLPSKDARLRVQLALKEAKIENRLWWGEGLHKMPAFSNLKLGSSVVVDDIATRYLGLPFFVGMEKRVFERIGLVVSEALR